MWLKILGSAAAGMVGFAVGFYAGLFVVLTIWGLDADAVWYPTLTAGLGSLFAGSTVALTVTGRGRTVAVAVAAAAGALLVLTVIATDAEFETILMGGGLVAVAAATGARIGEATAR